jgi:uncharacterized membrane protein
MFNRKTIAIILMLLAVIFIAPAAVFAQDAEVNEAQPDLITPEEFFKAEVLDIYTKEQETAPGFFEDIEMVRLKALDGTEADKEIEARNLYLYQSSQAQKVTKGDIVVASKVANAEGDYYYVADKYRLTNLYWLVGLFFALAILFARLKGLSSILGLVFSIFVLAWFIVPQILNGKNPLIITLVGSCVIAFVSIYLAHGFNRRASVALLSTLITLGISSVLAVFFVGATQLFGLGSEEAFYLQGVPDLVINLKGLLLGGIIIGTLGVLDDITASQTAAVDEIRKANPALTFKDLYRRGLSVGHEHIAALINTLALAYAGASLPLFLLFNVYASQPVWVTLNSEFIAEEVVRTLVGSVALILAVPISTFLAAYILTKTKTPLSTEPHAHVH